MPDEPVVQTPDAPTEPETTTAPTQGEPEAAPATIPAPEGKSAISDETRHRSAQERINKAVLKQREAEREADYWKAKATSQSAEPVATIASDREPQEAEFADYGQYLKALTKWEIRQDRADAARAALTQQQQDYQAELSRAFTPQLQTARAKYDDFDEVVAQPIFSSTTQDLLFHSPQGAEIAYFLGTNPQEALRLNELSPVAAAREIIKLEARFVMQPKTVSSAPAPITPVTGTAPALKDEDTMTTDEWMAHERQKRIAKLKASPFS
jgi:hypothetical protein